MHGGTRFPPEQLGEGVKKLYDVFKPLVFTSTHVPNLLFALVILVTKETFCIVLNKGGV